MSWDIDGPAREFHQAATLVARLINPHKEGYITNEIKVQTLNVCTCVLVFTAGYSVFQGSIPFTMGALLLNGCALVGRVIAERSLNPTIFDRPGEWFIAQLEKLELLGKANIPLIGFGGRGLFYLSPWLKEQLEEFKKTP